MGTLLEVKDLVVRVGERRLLKLLREYGVDTVAEAVGEILESAERRTRASIRSWKDGVYRGEAILDDDGHGTTDIPIESIRLKLIREGFEDYEYLALAARRGLSGLADASVASVATNLYEWNRSPEALYAARRVLGDNLGSQRSGAQSPRN